MAVAVKPTVTDWQPETFLKYTVTPMDYAEDDGNGPRNETGGREETANLIKALMAEVQQLHRMFAQAPGFIAVLRGPSLVYEVVNEAYYQLVGHRELIGRPIQEALPELGGQGYLEILKNVFCTGRPFSGALLPVTLQRTFDGPTTTIYVDLLFQPLIDDEGNTTRIFIQGHDVTKQRDAIEALNESNQRLNFALEGARAGIWDWTFHDNEVVYSKRWKEILGYGEGDIPNRYQEWVRRIHPDDRQAALEDIQATMKEQAPLNIEYRLQCKDGTYKWVISRGVVVARDERGRPARMSGTMTDISDKKKSEEMIWQHANFDILTGLPNRRLFRDRLEQEIRKAHRTGDEIALLFIDLDHFKEVNDLHGHDVGDQLLNHVASRLSSCIRESDTVARLGGDEFTIILTELHEPHIELMAQKITQKLAMPFVLNEGIAHISASVGITLYPADADNTADLIRNADQAMYAAKAGGRNHFRFFTKSMHSEAQNRVRLAQDLRSALTSKRLKVYFQPIVDLSSGEISKAEALLRWNHDALGDISPARFIPIAEESGLIHEIGDFVFSEAVSWAMQWSAKSKNTFEISINKSPIQFTRGASIDWPAYLAERGLPAGCVTVEITEGVLLNASTQVATTLDKYKDTGIRVALDDFGTGYSSLAYLKRFHIDCLKIDQSFIRDISVNESSRAIAESIIAMAHRLGIRVIAEGIEEQNQLDILRLAGCDYGQGFIFSKAVPPIEFEALLENRMS
ncbi:putative bifunctional diguanylate cyclase/phosphodiesterase [Noviherbaspirillum pedocola]|uniref:EAL domain-containing protein n=1 Tax=Noviherbaspirillum pedocola TaxID=2801341 RepID=A0A934W3D9_9BURK|nr:GGDEF and EAL domain-containing protein [Noviherbaspirillum pedocola]MBK4737336.1 EAL domain-containing protein [Noviherbaspirillum pedocola]